ncbi:MAG: hypothetical protein AB1601_09235 [Planctomycetota bacterium]
MSSVMTAMPTTASSPRSRECPITGATVPLDTVRSPGAYVCGWSGHLLRVFSRGLMNDESPVLNIVGGEPLTVTKISEDPGVPLPEARGLAWSLGLSVRF